MTEKFQNLSLFNIDGLTLSADIDVVQEFNLLEVKFSGESELVEVWLHSMAVTIESLDALLEVDCECGLCACSCEVLNLFAFLLEGLFELFLSLITQYEAYLTFHVLR